MKIKFLASALAIALSSGVAQAEEQIRFDTWPDHDKSFEGEIGKIFEKEHPKIKVEVLANNWPDHHNKLTTTLATGSGAGDVVTVDVEKIGAYVNEGGFVNLSKEFGADKLEKLFPAYAWAQGKGTDGSQYAIPMNLGPGVMYYRREHMEDKGFKVEEVIKTWDSLLAYGEKLKEKKVALVGNCGSLAQAIINTTVEPGNSIFFSPKGEPVVTNERFNQALTVAKTCRDKGLDARIGDWSNEWFEGLREGKFATQLSGAWLVGFLQGWIAPETGGKWGVSNVPNGVYGSWGGTFLAIPTQSKNKKAAWEVVKFLGAGEAAQIDQFKRFAAFPSVVGTYDDPMFNEEMAFLKGQKGRLLFAEIAEKIQPVKPHKADNVARQIILENVMGEVLNEGKDIKKALADAEKLIKRRTRSL